MLPSRLKHVAKQAKIPVEKVERSAHWIYVIRCEGFVKIGIAGDPQARLRDMQVGNPFPLILVAKFWTDNARRDERALHWALRPHRQRGEWFKVTDALEQLLKSYTVRRQP